MFVCNRLNTKRVQVRAKEDSREDWREVTQDQLRQPSGIGVIARLKMLREWVSKCKVNPIDM